MDALTRDPPEPSGTAAPSAARAAGCTVDRSETLRAAQRFAELNRARRRRALLATPPAQRIFLELLPLLFHVNHPALPGFCDRHTPVGIARYRPSARTCALARRIARSFSGVRRRSNARELDALYLMGSTGSLAQGPGSDLDIWLCHRADLDPGALPALRAKADAVSAWAARLGLEAHIFLMSADEFRERGADRLSSESSGSAQHRLLLDEFYRSAVLLAGRAPIWWLVPAGHEEDYSRYVATLLERRFVRAEDYIDFGSVAAIEAAEFFGATLWQLSKAIAAPYKSLLKLMLLEAYAADFPTPDLVSTRLKRAVHEGCTDPDRLDGYLLVLRRIEEHLLRIGDHERLDLARRCLYRKVGHALSRPPPPRPDWRYRLLESLSREWGWERSRFALLDGRRRWRIEQALAERRTLVNALRASYRHLSVFARAHAEVAMLSERDMTLLGRKLFAAFEQKAGKIDIVARDRPRALLEERLHLRLVEPDSGQPYWRLATARGSTESPRLVPVKRGWTPLELIAWAHFNGLLGPATRVEVEARGHDLEGRDVAEVGEFLRRHFAPTLVRCSADVEELARMPHLLAVGAVINLGLDPLGALARNGHWVATRRTDPLSFSGGHEVLVREIDYLAITSWHEALTFKHQGMEGLLACLCEHLRWIERGQHAQPTPPPVHCCTPRHGELIGQRIEELFADVSGWFTAPGAARRRRYVLRGGDSYYVLLATPELVSHEFSGDEAGLGDLLASANPEFTAVTFDRRALDDDLLARVYALNRPEVVQLFFLPEGGEARILLLDERGSLFRDTVPFHSAESLLSQFQRFFDALSLRRQTIEGGGALAVEYHRVTRSREHGYRLERSEWSAERAGAHYCDLRVIGELVGGETVFTVYCDGVEFSTQEHGLRLFEAVTRHILARRKSGERYPVYITDIDLSQLPRADGAGRQTVHYLDYKRRIERRLNRALHQG